MSRLRRLAPALQDPVKEFLEWNDEKLSLEIHEVDDQHETPVKITNGLAARNDQGAPKEERLERLQALGVGEGRVSEELLGFLKSSRRVPPQRQPPRLVKCRPPVVLRRTPGHLGTIPRSRRCGADEALQRPRLRRYGGVSGQHGRSDPNKGHSCSPGGFWPAWQSDRPEQRASWPRRPGRSRAYWFTRQATTSARPIQ